MEESVLLNSCLFPISASCSLTMNLNKNRITVNMLSSIYISCLVVSEIPDIALKILFVSKNSGMHSSEVDYMKILMEFLLM